MKVKNKILYLLLFAIQIQSIKSAKPTHEEILQGVFTQMIFSNMFSSIATSMSPIFKTLVERWFGKVDISSSIKIIEPSSLKKIKVYGYKEVYEENLKYLKSNLSKGLLLYGPPGNGKTSFIKKVAADLNLPIVTLNSGAFHINPSDKLFLIKYIIDIIKKKKGECILFFDELDLCTKNRKHGPLTSNQEQNLAILLSILDGLELLKDKPVIVGTTNFLYDVDSALKRTGRLGRKIEIKNPSRDDISEIFFGYIGKKSLEYIKKSDTLESYFEEKFDAISKNDILSVRDIIEISKELDTLIQEELDPNKTNNGTNINTKINQSIESIINQKNI